MAKRGVGTGLGSRRHGLRRIGLSAVLFVSALLLSGCSAESSWVRLGWPMGITPEAESMRTLWIWSVWAALAVGVLVWGLTFWVVAFHRKKKDSPEFPRQTAYNVPLEMFYTVVPFIAVVVLFYFTVVVQNKVNDVQSDPEVVVDVTAFQWNWKFGYREVAYSDSNFAFDGVDTEAEAAAEAAGTPPVSEEGESEHGAEVGPIANRASEDLSYLNFDTIETVGTSDEIPVLVLPTGKRIEFILNSADVIHAFWVPEFLFKRDVMPHPDANNSHNVFQISEIDREGAFVGRCAEMCGTYHAMMNFEVRAVSPEAFQQYIEARTPVAEGGQGLTNAEALASIGESPIATSTSPFPTRYEIAATGQN
ncbi:aa3-type cytochrome oxidase subunit II [Millisia brevis]|uniref:aa3-type cytochrome oxidase subunit II n=1 Tax=Millisia brevis TaxID=264148 RepID=UPI000A4F99CB|nr:cytochrome c oxidase subunit II [Millisia brevis]